MKKILITLMLLTTAVFAQKADSLKVGLALQGGRALGFAHIGALSVIDSLEIPIDYVAGTSMGGLLGALYSMGFSAQEMEAFVLGLDWENIFSDAPSRSSLPYNIKKHSGKYQLEMEMDGFIPMLPSGIVVGQKIYKIFFNVTYPYEGIKSFDDLPIPFRCIGADLVTGNQIIFSDGSLAKAMRATMSIPTVFTPVKYDTALVIDGGMTNNFPVDVTKEMGADLVIGLNLISSQKNADYYSSLMRIIDRTIDVPRIDKLQANIDSADILIQQNITGYALSDFTKERIIEIINHGKAAAYKSLDELKALKKKIDASRQPAYLPGDKVISEIIIRGESGFSSTKIEKILLVKRGNPLDEVILKARLDRFNNSTILANLSVDIVEDEGKNIILYVNVKKIMAPIIKKITIVGAKKISEEFILNFLGLEAGKKININRLEHTISLLYGLNYFSAIHYTFTQNQDQSVLLNLEVIESSSIKFKFGLHYDDFYKLVGIIGFSGAPAILPGLFMFTEMQFSGLTHFQTDIFYPTRSIDFPVYPILTVGYDQIPRNLFNIYGQKVLRYDDTQWYFGGGIGISPIKFLNINTLMISEYPNIKTDIGNIDLGSIEINERIMVLQMKLNMDLLDDVLIPQNGVILKADFEYSSQEIMSNYSYGRMELSLDMYKTIGQIHTFRLYASYLRSWKEEPFYKTTFFIGGPISFIGLDYCQGFGPLFAIGRVDYLIQFLPEFYFRSAVNVAPYYQLGLPNYTHTGPALLGFGFGLMYDSILGPLEVSFSWGEKNTYEPGTYISRINLTAGYNL